MSSGVELDQRRLGLGSFEQKVVELGNIAPRLITCFLDYLADQDGSSLRGRRRHNKGSQELVSFIVDSRQYSLGQHGY